MALRTLVLLPLLATAVAAQARDLNARLAAFLTEARTRTLAQCTSRGITLPQDFLAWIDEDPLLRASVYGCRKDPLPVLLALRSLEIDLGVDTVRVEHPQLALAFAIQHSYEKPRATASPWNDGDVDGKNDALPDVRPRPRLVLTIPGDPRVPVDTKATTRALDRDDHIVNFLEDHAEIDADVKVQELPALEYDEQGKAKPRAKAVTVLKKVRRKPVGADVIAQPALQQEFTAYMAAHGHPDVQLDCGDRAVHWYSEAAVGDEALRARIAKAHELFHTAYRNKGRMPQERDRAPSMAESMAWLLRNERQTFPADVAKARNWPRFPLSAPWPLLLMLAADDQPLREREAIWQRFRDTGEMPTYGEYIGDIAQQFDMQSARRVSPFAFSYGSIQMMWKDGGVCGTMGNIGARTWRIVGVPASTAGQPGHCALVRMDRDVSGRFRCVGEQYASGGDEVTTVHAGWNVDDVGGRRPMVFHQSLAFAANHSFPALVETLVMRRLFDALPPEQKAGETPRFVESALQRNPFALAMLDGAIAASEVPATLLAIVDTFERLCGAQLDAKEHALYRTTVRDLAHARIGALPAPQDAKDNQQLLDALERQGCTDGKLLARCWRAIDGEAGFTARTTKELETYLAAPGRTKERRVGREVARRVKTWSETVKGKAAKAAWAEALLPLFAGKETFTLRSKPVVDPVVVELCKLAGREAPKVDAGK